MGRNPKIAMGANIKAYGGTRPFKTMGYGLSRSPFFVWGGIWGGK